MIEHDIMLDMINDGALVQKDGSSEPSFFINYYIVQKKYPKFLVPFIEMNLNEIELSMYRQGYVNYEIRKDGLLQWYVTPAGKQMANKLNDTH